MSDERLYQVKIIKADNSVVYDYYDNQSVLFPVSTDWESVTLNEKLGIEQAISKANAIAKDKVYILIEYDSGLINEVFAKASDFVKEMEIRQKAEEERRKKEKEKREETARKRKIAKLKKLQEELGEID